MNTRLFGVALLIVSAISAASARPAYMAPTQSAANTRVAPAQSGQHPAGSPLIFIANAGQVAPDVRYMVQGEKGTLFIANDAIWLTAIDLQQSPASDAKAKPFSNMRPHSMMVTDHLHVSNVKISFVGANPHASIESFGRLPTHVSYFRGDPSAWQSDIPVWQGVRYTNLYPGIDLELSGASGELAARLKAQPGANLAAVRMRIDGADSQMLAGNQIRLRTRTGEIAFPLLQLDSGTTSGALAPSVQGSEIRTPFAASADAQTTDATTQASTDLSFSSFLGGSFDDIAWSIAADSSGATYVTGETFSPDFPTRPGSFDLLCGTDGHCDFNGQGYYRDAFVAKMNPQGSDLVYAAFLGGSGVDIGNDIAVNSAGEAAVTGATYSADFPSFIASAAANQGSSTTGTREVQAFVPSATQGAQPNSSTATDDAFVVKINAAGTQLVYSQIIFGGGSRDAAYDTGYGVAFDGFGSAYVSGSTATNDFNAFVIKLAPNGSLLFGPIFGGSGNDEGFDVAVSDNGSTVYVTGYTESSDFPTTSGAPDQSCGSDGTCDTQNGTSYSDAFIAKFNQFGTRTYGTYVGGNNVENGFGIVADQQGAAYITGVTFSADFPVSNDAYDTTLGGNRDAILAKLSPNGSNLSYATFLGGDNADQGVSLALAGGNNVLVTGWTLSADFPHTFKALQSSIGGGTDAFLALIDLAASKLRYGTFLGGTSNDEGFAVATDAAGGVNITGRTVSGDFPTTDGALDRAYASGFNCGTSQQPNDHPCYDGFIAKIRPTISNAPELVSEVNVPFSLINTAIGTGVIEAPPCDAYESNDDYKHPFTIQAGQSYSAKLCQNDKEDNYIFAISRKAKPRITVDIPQGLRGKVQVWLFDPTNPNNTICGYGDSNPIAQVVVSSCPALAPGQYIVVLYTDDSQQLFDNNSPYTLKVTLA
ncbi:MAG TPA: hypothetical protein PKK15_15015 [Kouleothrix sp.]|uniref:DUF7948 domain-containing protein n=1 Tax=Kouleothrix sp. TaxID=2779161 RepID=UPI002C64B343|nr:hypothetical protein [Kouleothrix sp.]